MTGLLLVAYEINQNNDALSIEVKSVENEIAFSSFESVSSFYQEIASSEEFARIWLAGNQNQLTSEIDKERYSRMTWIWYESFFQMWAAWDNLEKGSGDHIIQQLGKDAAGNPGLIATLQRSVDRSPDFEFNILLKQWLDANNARTETDF